MQNRREFMGLVSRLAAFMFLLATSALSLVGCSAGSVVQKVLALLPTIEAIANTIASVLAAVDPGIGTAIKAALAIVETSFTIVQNIIKQYQSNIAGMPSTVLNDLDAAIAAIQTQITQIEAQFPNLPVLVVTGINVGLAAFQTILTLIAALIPAPAAAAAFPKAYAKLSARGIKFGVTPAFIPTPRELAQSYNHDIKQAGFPQAQVHVPWNHTLWP
jgi:phage-related protein